MAELVCVVLILQAVLVSGSNTVINWASSPVSPGSVVLLQGSFPVSSCIVSFASYPQINNDVVGVLPIQQTNASLKVVQLLFV